MAAGWGAVEYRGNISKQLKTVYLLQKDEYCTKHYGSLFKENRHICANADGVDICNGDSGGPLMTVLKGSVYLVGLSSWNFVCGDYHKPSVFVRVSSYLDWISRNTLDGLCYIPFNTPITTNNFPSTFTPTSTPTLGANNAITNNHLTNIQQGISANAYPSLGSTGTENKYSPRISGLYEGKFASKSGDTVPTATVENKHPSLISSLYGVNLHV
ncbi:hypothetical protein B4U80_11507 [Leptotrombidium deliense]|uniref:Peptidase S1 domain-containing protein n=1 Tax=Leptotrombidium deliense TaxID=299467 RepID=A0A443S089_9ACAR|nr:hypothetical protein B4U80_11507 [Leptotrombidium deliense]